MITFKRKNDQISSVVLDTSGIIDGRILEIAKAGFLPPHIIVAQFVIAELQFLADHGDTHKRERARYGLDVIRELQDIRNVEVSIARAKFPSIREVDDKLVALAKQYGAMLYTTDFNLNKVAKIEGVAVLNVNELAHALRPNLLPGERVTIKLTQVGQDRTQGVGYLNDGTMVVVEQAGRYVGQQVQAVCTRILQTQAGKMMFATLANKPSSAQPETQPRPNIPSEQQPPRQQQSHNPQHNKHRPTNQRPSATQQAPQTPPAVYHAQPQSTQARKKKQPSSNGTDRPVSTARTEQNQSPRAQQAQTGRPAGQRQQQQRPRNQNQQRRLSPEDSLLATLKEIQK